MLIDTHVWIWFVEGSRRLGVSTKRRLARSTRLDGPVTVSAASILEIAAHGMPFVTADRKILRYAAATKLVSVVDAAK